MSMDAEQIVDRRRLRRKLSFWRVIAFVALAVVVIGALLLAAGPETFVRLAGPQIARVTISGFITDNREQSELLDKIARADGVKGVIVAIDSGGGATAGGEALYEGLRRLAAKKPTVATIGTIGASAAYMAAIGTDHVIARRSSITGSIGVIFDSPEVSQLLDKLGVRVEEVKSAPLKAEPSPFHPASPEAKAVIAGIVADSYDWFVDIVAKRRNLARPDARALADGRIFTGRQALDAKLIDEIGGEDAAIDWLASKGVNRKLPVKDWERARSGGGWFSTSAAVLWVARAVGIAPELLGNGGLAGLVPERLKLDGLLSVWQGPSDGVGEPR
jgi:protease-4